MPHRPVRTRIKDFEPVEEILTETELVEQAHRCMNCGTPFCHGYGCPLANEIPDINRLVAEQRWTEAAKILLSTNNFPEFTGRICPALCEASCVLDINDEAVSVRAVELAVIEKAFSLGIMENTGPSEHGDKKVAVIGSGPAGLTVADQLNKAGVQVTVFEKDDEPGGLLFYGIPDFKLPRNIVRRRIDLMRRQGITFETGATVGSDISPSWLLKRFDALCLAAGARKARNLLLPGRNLKGIHFAMEFLTARNRAGQISKDQQDSLNAEGRDVVIIGGGDTGADCLGTAIRQGAKSITQLEILPEPPQQRPQDQPWPCWPKLRRDSSSHEEGGKRFWSVNTREFSGKDGRVTGLKASEVKWHKDSEGKWQFNEKEGAGFELQADLVLLALGFQSPCPSEIAENLRLKTTGQGNVLTRENYSTSMPSVFAVGDLAIGQSLVVKAMADARRAAKHILSRINA